MQNMHRNSRQLYLIREKDHSAHPVSVIQVKKIDSSNKNNARSALKQLRSDRETSDGMGMCLGKG